jgi:hypothetical protein
LRIFPWPGAIILNLILVSASLVATYIYSSLWYFVIGFIATYVVNSILRRWQMAKLAEARASMLYGEQFLETTRESITIGSIVMLPLAAVMIVPCLIIGYEDYNLILAGMFLLFSLPLMLLAWFSYYRIDGEGIIEHSAIYPIKSIPWTKVKKINIRQRWPRSLELTGDKRKMSIDGSVTNLDILAQVILDRVSKEKYTENSVLLNKMAKREWSLPNGKESLMEFFGIASRYL